jgi:hypothetical protein
MSTTTVNAHLQANQNPEFARILRAVKKSLPMIAVIFTLGIYFISALAEGGFLNILIGKKVLFGVMLSYGISFGIQIGRMLLVYLPIMNAVTPRFNLVGEITGILLGAFAMASIWNLIKEIGFSDAVAITLCLLIVLGVVIEIYILREMKKQIKVNMLTDDAYMQDLVHFYTREKQMEQMLNDLDQGQIPATSTLFKNQDVEVGKMREQMATMQKEYEELKIFAMSQRQAPTKAQLKKGLEEFGAGNAPTPSKEFSLNGIPEELMEAAA